MRDSPPLDHDWSDHENRWTQFSILFKPNFLLKAGSMTSPWNTGSSWGWRCWLCRIQNLTLAKVCLHCGFWTPRLLLRRTYRRLHPRRPHRSQASGCFKNFPRKGFNFGWIFQVQREKLLTTEDKFAKELKSFTDTARRVSFHTRFL